MRKWYTLFVFVLIAGIDNTVLALLPALTPTIRMAALFLAWTACSHLWRGHPTGTA